MPKFHLSTDGVARPCKATSGKCPLGSAEHGTFESQAAATGWAEGILKEEFSDRLLQARIGRRVESALAGENGHWDKVGAYPMGRREIQATSAALVSKLDADNYDSVVAAHREMILAGQGSLLDFGPFRRRAAEVVGSTRANMDASALIHTAIG